MLIGAQDSGSSSSPKESGQLFLVVGVRVLSGHKGVSAGTSDGIKLKCS